MSKFVGRRGSFGLSKESSRGTIDVASIFWIPVATISFDDRAVTARETQGLGVRADSDSNYVTQKWGEGEVECELYDAALGAVLASLIGAVPSSSGGPPYTHTYTLSDSNQPQSYTLVYKDPDTNKVFPLGVVDSLRMVVEQNAIVRYTLGFKSRVSRDWSTLTPDYTSLGNKFLHQHLQFKLAADTSGIAAASALSLKRLELNIMNNAIHDTVLGTVEPEDVLGQQFSVEGSIQLNKEDETYRNYMLAGTYRAMQVRLLRSASSDLTIRMPRVDFTEWEQDRTLDQIVSQNINVKANYDAENAAAIIDLLTLINAQASY